MPTKLMSAGVIAGFAMTLPMAELPANVDMTTQQQGTPLQGVHPGQYGTPSERGRMLSPGSESEMRHHREVAEQRMRDTGVVYGAAERGLPTDLQEYSQFERMRVENTRGERLGAVEDFLMDLGTGQVQFVVVSTEDIEGGDGQLRVVPPRALEHSPEQDRLVLDVSERRWQNAPAFRHDELAQLDSEREAREVYRHYEEDFRTRAWGGAQRPAQRGADRSHDEAWGSDLRSDPQPRETTGPQARVDDRRDFEWADRADERTARGMDADEPAIEFGARDRGAAATDAAARKPTLRNPSLHHSTRGAARQSHEVGARADSPELRQEFGARPQQRGQEFGARGDRERQEGTGQHRQRTGLQQASQLMGQEIRSEGDEAIGEVSDFLIDLRQQQVHYIIIESDEVAEGERFALPLADMQVERDTRLAVDTSIDQLQDAPEYNLQAAQQQNQVFRYETREWAGPGERERERTGTRTDERDEREFGTPGVREPREDDIRDQPYSAPVPDDQRVDEEREFGAQETRERGDEQDRQDRLDSDVEAEREGLMDRDQTQEREGMWGQEGPQGQERGQDATARGQEVN